MPFRQFPLLHQVLDLIRQLEQPEQIRDRRAITTNQSGDLRLGQLELLAETLISRRLVDGGQIVPLKIFDQRQRQQSWVVNLPDNGGNLGPAQALNRPPTALSRDELVLAVLGRTITG